MEEQLARIADAFERIANSFDLIQEEGLQLWSQSGCLRLNIDHIPLPDCYPPVEFPASFSIELKNESIGTKTFPFEISQS